MRRQRYIHDGSVIGDPMWIPKPWHAYIDWKRFAWVGIPLMILLVTNPANQQVWGDFLSLSAKRKPSKWLAPRITNYGIVSLEEKIEGVVVSGLLQDTLCSFKSPQIGSICEALADNMCHQKPLLWDPRDKAYTAHRLICWILMCSSLSAFCCPRAPPRRIFAHPIADGILASVFYPPRNLLHDLVYESFCVYPTLVQMNTMIAKLNSTSILRTGDETVDFLIAFCILVFVIGGASNLLSTRIDGQGSYITGFSPVIAAALAYHQRITVVRASVLVRLFGCDMTAGRLYLTGIGGIVFTYPNSWFPRMMAWLIAGLAGSFLAKYHLENMAVWGDMLKFFGVT